MDQAFLLGNPPVNLTKGSVPDCKSPWEWAAVDDLSLSERVEPRPWRTLGLRGLSLRNTWRFLGAGGHPQYNPELWPGSLGLAKRRFVWSLILWVCVKVPRQSWVLGKTECHRFPTSPKAHSTSLFFWVPGLLSDHQSTQFLHEQTSTLILMILGTCRKGDFRRGGTYNFRSIPPSILSS